MKKTLFLSFILLPLLSLAQPGIITTIAGGAGSVIGDGGPATNAFLYNPTGAVSDHHGNVYIADQGNNRVRKVDNTGTITTIAGTGSPAHSGDHGPATAADVAGPTGIAIDRVGNLYFTESGYLFNYVRKIDTAGVITTIAGTGAPGDSGDGFQATTAVLNIPVGVAVDTAGNVYVADQGNNEVREITVATGIINVVAGNGLTGALTGDGGPATGAIIQLPSGVAVDRKGNLYITDDNERIRKVDAGGRITSYAGSVSGLTYTGDGGPATDAVLYKPRSVAVDSFGAVYFDDDLALILKVDTNGIITTVAGNNTLGAGFSGDGGPATIAQLQDPRVAVGAIGTLYISDMNNDRVRKTPPDYSYLQAPTANSIGGNIYVYPNPATNELTIKSTSVTLSPAEGQIKEVTITNLLGQTVHQSGIRNPASSIKIDVGNLPDGVYFVKINGTEVRKFVKEN